MKILVRIVAVSAGILLLTLFFLFRGERKTGSSSAGVHKVKAREVIQSENYTYVRVSEGSNDYWCAINKENIQTGKTYYWIKGWEVNDFHSRELDKTFSSILFIESLSREPLFAGASGQAGAPVSMPGRQAVPEKEGIKVESITGGITIAGLYENRKDHRGKPVKIRGEVVKFSPMIMNRNWVHLQDGTRTGDFYDLVVTTQDSVKTGETVIFEGIISLDKDFGSGYNYEVIMEDARLVK